MPTQKNIEDWRELMESFNQNGLEDLPKLLGTQKEFESGCIPRQDSLEMLTQGESVISKLEIKEFDKNECPSGFYSKTNSCGENFLGGKFNSFLMQEETKEFNNSEQVLKALFNLPTTKIIYHGKSIPKRKNRRK